MLTSLNFGRFLRPSLTQASRLNITKQTAFSRHFSGIFPHHKDTVDNNSKTHFDFTVENYKRVNIILSKYPENYRQSACIPLLDLAQRQNDNFLTLSAMNKVAEIIGVSPIRVYEVATFYTMFNREKVGKYYIQLCGTTPCQACGADEIKKTILDHLGLKDGEEHTADGLFTVREVECLGACVNAPMVQLNDDFYEQLTPATTIELLEACKQGKPPVMTKWGSLPMNGQLSCEGPLGKTSLHGEQLDIKTVMRSDAELKPKTDDENFISPENLKKKMYYDA